ncbi:YihY/virulence factor BrkB family protein [Methanolobus halotolerans]|uniref:YihY/virulence factor BrkB family protein n=1 Tax=Methanolobus halotolerans TaxID=2052935 RepID=A0A4E0Q4R6_9EURY|nr:YihY/virulence factor BrkB family protein [Methanolobus halotolerans]TGC08766.1 YihY/virulence factor BrkB family protein [Methanolobus halotolerans]
MSKIKEIAVQTYRRWSDYDGMTDSAALAFIFLMSLPALLLFTISLGSMFVRDQALQQRIIDYVSNVAGQATIDTLNSLFQQIPDTSTLTLGLIISILLFLWTSGNLFNQFQKTINGMWNVDRAYGGYKKSISERISAILAVLAFVLIILLSTIFEVIIMNISRSFQSIFPLPLNVIQYSSSILNFLVIMLLFVYLYRVLPETRLDMKYVLAGSFLTVVFITLGKYAFSLYLMFSNPASVYGSIGSLIAILLWIYITAIIVTIMTEFTKVYADYDNSRNATSK